MPTPKKAAKNAPGHYRDKHHQSNDLRRAYEHMGRVAVLRQFESPMAGTIAELATLSQRAIKDGHSKDAADLLRASEHLSFAVLASDASGVVSISAELKQSITEHFDEVTRRANENWEEEEHSNILAGIYHSCRNSAAKAFNARAYHQALEYARCAEALAHVKQPGPLKLERGHQDLQPKNA